MKKPNLFHQVLILALLAIPGLCFGQIEKKPVHFQKDSVGITLKGKIKGDQIIDYQLGGAAGQWMTVDLKTSNASNYFNVLPPGSEDVAIYNSSINGNTYGGTLEKAGTYTVRVYLYRNAARRGESADYTIRFQIYNDDGD